jgi:hypothetical protein
MPFVFMSNFECSISKLLFSYNRYAHIKSEIEHSKLEILTNTDILPLLNTSRTRVHSCLRLSGFCFQLSADIFGCISPLPTIISVPTMARTMLRKNLSAEIWNTMPFSVCTHSAFADFTIIGFNLRI